MKLRRDSETVHRGREPKGYLMRPAISIIAIAMATMLLLSAIIVGVSATSSNWITMSIDSENDVGQFSSIAVDANGEIYISYYDATLGRLMYAHTSDGSWVIQVGDNVGNVGKYSSIAIDSNGSVHISYYDVSNGNLKYATNASGLWSTSVLDQEGNVGQYTSIAIDSNDKVHISYYDADNGNLKYATNQGGPWDEITVDDEGNVGQHTSIAIDLSDKVHISYYDVQNGNLKYATNADGIWDVSPLDSVENVGLWTSIGIGVGGTLHISYYDATNTALKYASNPGGIWAKSILSDEGDVGMYSSLAVDSMGAPHISCYDSTLGNLVYMGKSSGEWNATAIDEGEVGMFTSIAVDSVGNLHISYHDSANLDLKYAYSQNELPSAPQGLNATGGDEYVLLEWEAPLDPGFSPVNHYVIYRGTSSLSLIELTTTTELTFNDTNVINEHPYYYKVSARNSYGEGVATEIVFAIPNAEGVTPSAPQNLEVYSDGLWAQLNWDPPVKEGASEITNYYVYRGTSALSLSLYAPLGVVTSYNDTDVVNGQTYYYSVSALNSEGEGDRSNLVTVTPYTPIAPTTPSAPLNLSATPSSSSITLHWDPPANDGGSPITNYKIYRGTSSDSITLLTTVGNVLQYNDTSVETGTTYYYRVAAFNSMGEGDEASTSTSIGGGGIEIDPVLWLGIIAVVIIVLVVLYFLLMRGGGGSQPQKPKEWTPKDKGKGKGKW